MRTIFRLTTSIIGFVRWCLKHGYSGLRMGSGDMDHVHHPGCQCIRQCLFLGLYCSTRVAAFNDTSINRPSSCMSETADLSSDNVKNTFYYPPSSQATSSAYSMATSSDDVIVISDAYSMAASSDDVIVISDSDDNETRKHQQPVVKGGLNGELKEPKGMSWAIQHEIFNTPLLCCSLGSQFYDYRFMFNLSRNFRFVWVLQHYWED